MNAPLCSATAELCLSVSERHIGSGWRRQNTPAVGHPFCVQREHRCRLLVRMLIIRGAHLLLASFLTPLFHPAIDPLLDAQAPTGPPQPSLPNANAQVCECSATQDPVTQEGPFHMQSGCLFSIQLRRKERRPCSIFSLFPVCRRSSSVLLWGRMYVCVCV